MSDAEPRGVAGTPHVLVSAGEARQASFLDLVPHILWFGLASVALYLFSSPAAELLKEAHLSKLGIGVFQVEFAQEAALNIKGAEGAPRTPAEFKPIADRAKLIQTKLTGAYVLWVDDNNPSQNVQERRVLQNFGIRFDLASSTEEALRWLDRAHYDAVISDIGRPAEASDKTPCLDTPIPAGAGCAMLKTMHERYGEAMPPTILYSASYPQSSPTPAHALGVTNRVDKLFGLVFDALERRDLSKGDT